MYSVRIDYVCIKQQSTKLENRVQRFLTFCCIFKLILHKNTLNKQNVISLQNIDVYTIYLNIVYSGANTGFFQGVGPELDACDQ